MSLSSIFSFKTLKLKRRPGEWGTLIFILLSYLAIEVVFAYYSGAREIERIYPNWKQRGLPLKLEYMKKQAAKKPIDVLFLGDSVGELGFDPEAFDNAFNRINKDQIFSFNGSLSGSSAGKMDILLRDFYAPISKPESVIYGVSPWMINEGVDDYLILTESFKSDVKDNRLPIYLKNEFNMDFYYTMPEINGRITKFLELPSLKQQKSDHVDQFNERGFMPLEKVYEPPKVEEMDGRLKFYNPHGQFRTSLENTARWCRENNIMLILVNHPMHRFMYEEGAEKKQVFLLFHTSLRAIAKKYDAVFLDLNEKIRIKNEEYYDSAHLNAKGANRLSKLLAIEYAKLRGKPSSDY